MDSSHPSGCCQSMISRLIGEFLCTWIISSLDILLLYMFKYLVSGEEYWKYQHWVDSTECHSQSEPAVVVLTACPASCCPFQQNDRNLLLLSPGVLRLWLSTIVGIVQANSAGKCQVPELVWQATRDVFQKMITVIIYRHVVRV